MGTIGVCRTRKAQAKEVTENELAVVLAVNTTAPVMW